MLPYVRPLLSRACLRTILCDLRPRSLRLTGDARLALQAEPGPTPPHPGAEAQGHELARLRREPAPARQLDGLVFGRGGRGVGGRAAHEPGRAARVFRPGDPDGADVQGRVPAGVPAD